MTRPPSTGMISPGALRCQPARQRLCGDQSRVAIFDLRRPPCAGASARAQRHRLVRLEGDTAAFYGRSHGRRRSCLVEDLPTRSCARTLEWPRCGTSSAAPLERIPPSPACLRASSALPGCPTLIVTFFDDQPRTTRHTAAVLAERLRGVRTLPLGGGGGCNATEAARDRPGAMPWRCGRCGRQTADARVHAPGAKGGDVGRARAPGMLPPLRPSHGLRPCTWWWHGKRSVTFKRTFVA